MPSKEENEEFDLNSIEPRFSLNNSRSIKDTNFAIKERYEKRKDIFHIVIHTLAFLIIIPFLIMIVFSIKIPPEYSTIVSIVIGFYFGKALFN